jgi:hypothetical protein
MYMVLLEKNQKKVNPPVVGQVFEVLTLKVKCMHAFLKRS